MKRRSLLLFIVLATAVAPAVSGPEGEAFRGRLLVDLPLHLEQAQKDLQAGLVDEALAEVNLILMDKPISYQIKFESVAEELRPQCTAAFRDGVAIWRRALGKDLGFEESGASEAPQVVITFQPEVQQNDAAVAGFVRWRRFVERDAFGVPAMHLSADIKIRTRLLDGNPMTLEHMRHTSAHELGHVLGLDDTRECGEMMGPLELVRPVADVDASELENLRAIRRAALELRERALALRG
jgi:hypothetical protein